MNCANHSTPREELEDSGQGIIQIREEVCAEALAYFESHPGEQQCRIAAPHGFFHPVVYPWMAGVIVTREGADDLHFSPYLRACAPCATPRAIQAYYHKQGDWFHVSEGEIRDVRVALRLLGEEPDEFGFAEWGAINSAWANEDEALARWDEAQCRGVAA